MKLIVGKDDNPVILLSSVFAKQLKTVESGKDSKLILNSGSEGLDSLYSFKLKALIYCDSF